MSTPSKPRNLLTDVAGRDCRQRRAVTPSERNTVWKFSPHSSRSTAAPQRACVVATSTRPQWQEGAAIDADADSLDTAVVDGNEHDCLAIAGDRCCQVGPHILSTAFGMMVPHGCAALVARRSAIARGDRHRASAAVPTLAAHPAGPLAPDGVAVLPAAEPDADRRLSAAPSRPGGWRGRSVGRSPARRGHS